MNHYLFLGPTAHNLFQEIENLIAGITILPPVARGDIQMIASEGKPGLITICDGIFHSYPAVGHFEIVEAMKKGWEIWGVGSMGAIRASELQDFGMHGFGESFENFIQDPDFPDDEVALLYDQTFPYAPQSEPMLHLRKFLDKLVAIKCITAIEASHIKGVLSDSWFGVRTIPKTLQLINVLAPRSLRDATTTGEDFDQFRTKSQDLIRYLTTRPWSRA